MITIIKDKPLINEVFDYDVILVGTGIVNALGNGFQYQVKVNFPDVDKANKSTNYGDIRKLGTVKVIGLTPAFCLLYIFKTKQRPDKNPDYLDYDALKKCMSLINTAFHGKRIATTFIGASKFDGNGDKQRILEILENEAKDIDLYIYDYEQLTKDEDRNKRWRNITSQIGNISTEEYRELKKRYYWENAYGIFKPMPENMTEYEIKQLIKKEKEGS